MRPLAHASNTSIATVSATTPTVATPQAETAVTISTMAPSNRSDGSANQPGDLWWSNHTGLLYVWNHDKVADFEQGELDWTGEWICTDPSGRSVTLDEPADVSDYGITGLDPITFAQGVTTIISEGAPLTRADGSPWVMVTCGGLWNGRMYIRYNDGDSVQWVVTNPYGVLTSSTVIQLSSVTVSIP